MSVILMEKWKGYTDYSEYKITPIHADELGSFCYGWININKETYLLKEEESFYAYKEVFYSRILEKMECKTVRYQLAIYRSIQGVVSKNYNVEKLPTISLYQLCNKVDEFYKKTGQTIAPTNTIDGLYKHIEFALKQFMSEEQIENIKRDIYIQYIMQFILGNNDLHNCNMELCGQNLSPFFDFGNYGEIQLLKRGFDSCYTLFPSTDSLINERPVTTVRKFLRQTEKKNLEIFKEYFEKARALSIANVLKEMEEEIEYSIPKDIKHELKLKYDTNIMNLTRILKEKNGIDSPVY